MFQIVHMMDELCRIYLKRYKVIYQQVKCEMYQYGYRCD